MQPRTYLSIIALVSILGVAALTEGAVAQSPNRAEARLKERNITLIESVARSIGQSLEVAMARNLDDLEPAFTQLVSAQVGAVLVSNDAFFLSQRVQLVALAKRHSLPASYEWREFPAVGGLMSYGPSLPGTFQIVGTYAARIIKGAQPSDLPIEQPTEFNLVINSATARSLGIHIPPTLIARADEVIE